MENSNFGYLTIVYKMNDGSYTSTELELPFNGWNSFVQACLEVARSQSAVISASCRVWGGVIGDISAHPSKRALTTKTFQPSELV